MVIVVVRGGLKNIKIGRQCTKAIARGVVALGRVEAKNHSRTIGNGST